MAGWLIPVGLAALAVAPFAAEALRRPVSARRAEAPGRMLRLSRGMTHVIERGPPDGPPVVLVHGLTTPAFVWEGLIPDLAAHGHRVIAYDHFGRGYSDRPRARQDGAFFSDHLRELLDALGVTQPAHLVGYSMGGAIVTGFAATHPERVAQLTLLAPAGMRADLGGLMRRAATLPVLGDWLMHATFPRLHRKGTEAERTLPSAVPLVVDRQQEELRYRGFIRCVLSSLRGVLDGQLHDAHCILAARGIPVLAIWGANDTVIPISGKALLSAWNPVARHVVIPGAGHGLTYTHADDVLKALTGAAP